MNRLYSKCGNSRVFMRKMGYRIHKYTRMLEDMGQHKVFSTLVLKPFFLRPKNQ